MGPLPYGRGSVAGCGSILALLGLFLWLIVPGVSPEPYGYDEGDYMYAASLGFACNWMDAGAMPMAEFLDAGFHSGSRESLSARIRKGNDALFYRHFHGPLFEYVLVAISRFGLSEGATRGVLLAIPAASLVLIAGEGWLAGLLFLSSYSVLGTTEVAPHQLFVLCALASMILLLRRHWYGAAVAAGFASCTLEVGIVLPITMLICGWVERRKIEWKPLAAFGATVAVIWPAAILRLSFVKAWAVMAYLTIAREAAWGSASFFEMWRSRFVHSPAEWILILAGLAAFWKTRRTLYPLALSAGLALAATARVLSLTPRYALAFMPVLDLLAGLALVPSFGPLRRPARVAVVTAMLAGLGGNAWYQAVHRNRDANPRSAAVLKYIHQNDLQNKALLAPQTEVPTLHYYFPRMRLAGYFGAGPTRAERESFVPDAIIGAAEP